MKRAEVTQQHKRRTLIALVCGCLIPVALISSYFPQRKRLVREVAALEWTIGDLEQRFTMIRQDEGDTHLKRNRAEAYIGPNQADIRGRFVGDLQIMAKEAGLMQASIRMLPFASAESGHLNAEVQAEGSLQAVETFLGLIETWEPVLRVIGITIHGQQSGNLALNMRLSARGSAGTEPSRTDHALVVAQGIKQHEQSRFQLPAFRYVGSPKQTLNYSLIGISYAPPNSYALVVDASGHTHLVRERDQIGSVMIESIEQTVVILRNGDRTFALSVPLPGASALREGRD